MAQQLNIDVVLRQVQQDITHLREEVGKMNNWVMLLDVALDSMQHDLRKLRTELPQVGEV